MSSFDDELMPQFDERFCSCGSLIRPAAVRFIEDGQHIFRLFDQCVNYESNDEHTRKVRTEHSLLQSAAQQHKLSQFEISALCNNQLLEKIILPCKKCASDQVHVKFLKNMNDMTFLVVCVKCELLSDYKDVWVK
ncbi:hypothetical protein SS50377_26521 [Spironucleus salmonicida]|uniref:Uncharacterized protein n=1 Tax=Spironucleus salmonicida TaxID=348837 RepID=V6LL17_9EUKA|nr:hypothetical protein SS50377_26521 [Spironucleus salmonicida]|eukprot:EST41374.1 Hypothetical protein SS50377_19090 [Spironucleus salmonicida]